MPVYAVVPHSRVHTLGTPPHTDVYTVCYQGKSGRIKWIAAAGNYNLKQKVLVPPRLYYRALHPVQYARY